jgi:hypothetical protein
VKDKFTFKEELEKELASRLSFQGDVKERALAAIRHNEKKRSSMIQRILSAAVLTVMASSLLLFIYSEMHSRDLLKEKSAANQMTEEAYVYRDTDFGFTLELPSYMRNELRTFDSANGRKFFFHSENGLSLPLFNIDIYRKGVNTDSSIKGRELIGETEKYVYYASNIEAGLQSIKDEIPANQLQSAERFAADFQAAVGSFQPAADEKVKYWAKDLGDFKEESQNAVNMAWTSLEKEYQANDFQEYFAVTKEQYQPQYGGSNLEAAKEKAMADYQLREESFMKHEVIDITPFEINQIEVKLIAKIKSALTDKTPEALISKHKLKNEEATYLATYEKVNGKWVKRGWKKLTSNKS